MPGDGFHSSLRLLSSIDTKKSIVDELASSPNSTVRETALLHATQHSPEWVRGLTSLNDIVSTGMVDSFVELSFDTEDYYSYCGYLKSVALRRIIEIDFLEHYDEDDDEEGFTEWNILSFCPHDPYLPRFLFPYIRDEEELVSRAKIGLMHALRSSKTPLSTLFKARSDVNIEIFRKTVNEICSSYSLNQAEPVDFGEILEVIALETNGEKRDILIGAALTAVADGINQSQDKGLIKKELVTSILALNDAHCKQLLASSTSLPTEIMELLSLDRSADVREQLANNKSITSAVLKRLLKDNCPAVRRAAAKSPVLTLETLDHVCPDEKAIAAFNILVNSELNESIISYFSGTSRLNAMIGSAENANAPHSLLSMLVDDEKTVQVALASNPKINDSVARYLVSTGDTSILLALASNSGVTSRNLARIAESSCVEARAAVVSNPNVSKDTVAHLANDVDVRVRRSVAMCKDLKSLRILADDKDESVRETVASNIHASRLILACLSKDESFCIRCSVARNTSASISTLKELAADQELSVRVAVASNVNTPVQLLIKFSRSEHGELRSAAFKNPSLPEDVVRNSASEFTQQLCSEYIDKLSRDGGKDFLKDPIRLFCLSRPECDPAILHKNHKSLNWLERYAIANNCSTPAETLSSMQQDGNILVREAILQRLGGLREEEACQAGSLRDDSSGAKRYSPERTLDPEETYEWLEDGVLERDQDSDEVMVALFDF